MKIENRIVLRLEGLEQNDYHLELSVFVEEAKHFLGVLRASAEDSGESGAVFHVVGLSHSSPATVECIQKNQQPQSAEVPADLATKMVMKNLNLVQNDKADLLSSASSSAIEKLTEYSSQKTTRAEIQIINGKSENKQVFKLDDHFRNILMKAKSAEERDISTVDGKLEQVNIHDSANTFKIYRSLPNAPSVACKFPPDLLENVRNALGKYVSVRGECFYHSDVSFPYKINVRKMEVLPPSDELPSLSDLYGIAPDATGNESSEQFVRKMRDGWDR